MSDAVEDAFADLDKFYPGSKKPRREAVASPKRAARIDPTGWDARPLVKNVRGHEVEMFTIGALAQAIGKSEVSVRLWQRRGYIPNTPFRLPTREVNGTKRLGRRLFTRSMIEAAIQSFGKRGLIDAPRIEWKNHQDISIELLTAWKTIQDSLV